MEATDTVGFIVALPQECRSLTRRNLKRLDTVALDSGRLVRVSGTGRSNAEAAAEELVQRGARRLVSWGCAGALAAELRPGDLVIADQTVTGDGVTARFCESWRGQLSARRASDIRVHGGAIAESPTVIDSTDMKMRLHTATGAIAVDMESYGVLRVASRHGLACVAVRAIADDQATALPRTVLNALNEHGELQFLSLLTGLLQRPSDLFALLKLNRCFTAAMHTLTQVARQAGPALGG